MSWSSTACGSSRQLLAAKGPANEPLCERLSGVALPLLNELQDLHDRSSEGLPSLFRDSMLADSRRSARMFGLSSALSALA